MTDLSIPLDKLLQLFVSIMINGSVAYDKKSQLLKPNADLFNNYSLRIQETLSIDNMIRLFVLFRVADKDRKKSDDLKTPVPYYLVGFLGEFLHDKSYDRINNALKFLFESGEENFKSIYGFFKNLTNLYKKKFDGEYNRMIKSPIDKGLIKNQYDTLETVGINANVKDFLKMLKAESKDSI